MTGPRPWSPKRNNVDYFYRPPPLMQVVNPSWRDGYKKAAAARRPDGMITPEANDQKVAYFCLFQ
jgi:hypothetical protein